MISFSSSNSGPTYKALPFSSAKCSTKNEVTQRAVVVHPFLEALMLKNKRCVMSSFSAFLYSNFRSQSETVLWTEVLSLGPDPPPATSRSMSKMSMTRHLNSTVNPRKYGGLSFYKHVSYYYCRVSSGLPQSYCLYENNPTIWPSVPCEGKDPLVFDLKASDKDLSPKLTLEIDWTETVGR